MPEFPTRTMEYKDFSSAVFDRAGKRGRVINAQVELTYGCNLHCVHCYTDCYNQPDLIKERELPYTDVVRILDELHEQGVLWLCFTGGEIFMRRDFLDIYAYAKQKGFIITLFTNGTMISTRIAEYLEEYPPFKIDISVHGVTEETYEKVTQVPGSYRQCMEGIRRLLDRGLPVDIKTKAMTLNRHELGEIKEFVEGLGLRFKLTTGIYPRLNGALEPCEFRLTPDEIVSLDFPEGDLDEEASCAASDEVPVGPPPDDRLYRCGCGTIAVHVSAWGELGTCTWQHQVRADLHEKSVAEGIAEVFPQIRAARYHSESPCRACQVYRLCDKNPNIAWAEASDSEQPVEHFCRTAFKRADRLTGRCAS
jgi:sulfatase maturation enzyme AslB (radical SAM superfamily)